MTLPKAIRQHKCMDKWCILSGYRGSIAHGMYVPNSDPNSIDDKDVMAICCPPIDHYFGTRAFGSRGTKEFKIDEWDVVVYEVRKFISLLTKANPNVLSLLWLEKQHQLKVTEAGQLFIDNRDAFVTKKAYHSFVGYAHGQLHRMTHHAFEGYMGEKRKALVEKYGYDTKNAAHLIRLLRMGCEFLVDGELQVERPDAQQLLEIKRGKWTLEQVKSEAEQLFKDARVAHIQSSLPVAPDLGRINDLCVKIVKTHLGGWNG